MHDTPAEHTPLVGLDDLREAAAALRGVAIRTPLLRADALSEAAGCDVWVKPEMLQRGAAFKFRGAYFYLSRLGERRRAAGVIAPSSGNHALAVTLAARLFGVPATVVMPTTVTAAKRSGVERLGGGARIVLAGTTTQERWDCAVEIAAAEGAVLVPPYDDAVIVAGQGTAGLEIAEDLPDVETVIVPVGGGGLSAGVATAVKLLQPSARVVGVEPAGAPKLTRALAAGAPVTLDSATSVADGLLAVRVGTIPFAHHRAYLDEVVTMDDRSLVEGVRFLLEHMKLVAEPSGAATVAALLTGAVRPRGKTVALLSGGNIDLAGLAALLSNG